MSFARAAGSFYRKAKVANPKKLPSSCKRIGRRPRRPEWKQTSNYDRYGRRSFDEGRTNGNYLATNLTRSRTTFTDDPNGICDKKKVSPGFVKRMKFVYI
jgi:hypothetical protein